MSEYRRCKGVGRDRVPGRVEQHQPFTAGKVSVREPTPEELHTGAVLGLTMNAPQQTKCIRASMCDVNHPRKP